MNSLKRKNISVMSAKDSFLRKVQLLLAQEKSVTKEEFDLLVFNFFTELTPAEDNYRQYILNISTHNQDSSRSFLSCYSEIPIFSFNTKEGGVF